MASSLAKGPLNSSTGAEWIIKNGSKYILHIMSLTHHAHALNVH